MTPRYPLPWDIALKLAFAILARRHRDFSLDARSCIVKLRPPPIVLGEENIPTAGPCLLTINHFSRPGFQAWWLALGVSSIVPSEIHWVVTETWTYPDQLRSKLFVPVIRWAFRRAADVYGFISMPPMPPRPEETQSRALAVRRVLNYARRVDVPVIGLAPEGQDVREGWLGLPPPGAGRFIHHLNAMGLSILPIGAFEQGEAFCLRFGPIYNLDLPPGLTDDTLDQYVSREVMHRIALLLPPDLVSAKVAPSISRQRYSQ
jgi:1-acyl-sn-glycerol-3-phosphate acyltransferase